MIYLIQSQSMKVVSLNVGLPRSVAWEGREIFTGIFKSPAAGALQVGPAGFEQDGVADPSVHGGVDKAVYAYPQEHYPHFAELLGRDDFVPGQFGENLTTTGMLETELLIGDRFRIGSALFEVAQPREPCFKLGVRMNDPGFVKVFLQSLRTGFYLRVIEEGRVSKGDEIVLEARAENSMSIHDIVRLKYFDRDNVDQLHIAASIGALPTGWRHDFRERLDALAN